MKVTQPASGAVQSSQSAGVGGSVRTERAGKAADASGARAAAGQQATIEGSTKSEISSRAKEMSKAKNLASQAPDVREAKVEELKRRIAAGKYNVDADAIADRLMSEHMATTKAGIA
jgi:negative regulator of flagellin synthesis FlgM